MLKFKKIAPKGLVLSDSTLFGPNGLQCVECKNWMEGCFSLPFSQMKVIKFFKEDNFKMVVCTNYQKEENVH